MKIPFLILISMLLLVPVTAQTVLYTAPSDQAVWAIYITSPVSTTGTIELYQANGDTVSGSWSYTFGLPQSSFNANLGGDTGSYNYFAPLSMRMGIWNGDNSTKGMRFIKMGFGQVRGIWNDVLSVQIDQAVITGYRINANTPITVTQDLVPRTQAAAALAAEDDEPGLVSLLISYTPLVVSIFASLFYWLKFLFVDHLVLTVLLYLTGSMAYAINTSKDIFKFYENWFKQQIGMFNFIANAFSTTFQIVTQVAVVVGNTIGSVVNIAVIAARILLRI